MIWIEQLRLMSAHSRVAQHHRCARVERLGFVSKHAR
jgi:hypothetical protein